MYDLLYLVRIEIGIFNDFNFRVLDLYCSIFFEMYLDLVSKDVFGCILLDIDNDIESMVL